MTNKENSSIIVHPKHSNEKKLAKQKRLMERQLKLLKKLRSRIKVWDDFQEKHEHKIRYDYKPLQSDYAELNLEFALVLDAAYQQTNETFSDAFKEQLSDIIMYLCDEVSEHEYSSEAHALLNKYKEYRVGKISLKNIGYYIDDLEVMRMVMCDAEVSEGLRFPKSFKPTSFLEAMEKIEELREKKKEKDQTKLVIEIPDGKFQRKPSLKTLYRKLASSLHPDRESDPIKREYKTKLMQQVNKEYKEKNIKKLIQLQSEIEVVDEIDIATIHKNEIVRENLILKQEIEELSENLYSTERYYYYEYKIDDPTPRKVNKALKEMITELKDEFKYKKSVLNKISKDFNALKEWVVLYHSENFE